MQGNEPFQHVQTWFRALASAGEGVTVARGRFRCGYDFIKGGASPLPGFPLVASHLRIQTIFLPVVAGVATQVCLGAGKMETSCTGWRKYFQS